MHARRKIGATVLTYGLLAAAVVGILTAVFTQWVSKFGKVDRGAAMGIVFTTLFAIGLILIRQAADHVDLDPHCVLYGALELATLAVGARARELLDPYPCHCPHRV